MISLTAAHYKFVADLIKILGFKMPEPAVTEKAAEFVAEGLKPVPETVKTARKIPAGDGLEAVEVVTIRGCLCYMPSPIQPYTIDLSYVNDQAKLLAWVLHLKPKNWITPRIIGDFIEIVALYKGWKLEI